MEEKNHKMIIRFEIYVLCESNDDLLVLWSRFCFTCVLYLKNRFFSGIQTSIACIQLK